MRNGYDAILIPRRGQDRQQQRWHKALPLLNPEAVELSGPSWTEISDSEWTAALGREDDLKPAVPNDALSRGKPARVRGPSVLAHHEDAIAPVHKPTAAEGMRAARCAAEPSGQASDPLPPCGVTSPPNRRNDGIQDPLQQVAWYRSPDAGIEDGETGWMQTQALRKGSAQVALMCCPPCSQPADFSDQFGGLGCIRHSAFTAPQARPFKSGVNVARIADKRLTLRLQKGDEPILGEGEKRAQYSAIRHHLSDRRHPGKPNPPAPRSTADQMGFDLIIAVMCGEQVQTAVLTAPAGEEPIARDARGLLYAGFRLFF